MADAGTYTSPPDDNAGLSGLVMAPQGVRRSARSFVGVFDSGLGGISILKELVRELSHESFVYFGDSANTPYGVKPRSWVVARSAHITATMLDAGAKAIVIACNTATSAAAADLRERWPYAPIVGVEPALKPAAEAEHHGRVLVMATEMTVRLEKFQRLAQRYSADCEVVALPCAGLAKRIEAADLNGEDLHELLTSLLGEYRGKVDGVVLGCTHYPFVKRQIRRVLGDVPFFDGSAGTARQLHRLLARQNLLASSTAAGGVEFRSSIDAPGQIARYRWFFDLPI